MGHFIENCRVCKKILRQCRCACCNQEQRWTICNDCKAKENVPPVTGTRKFKITVARQETVEMDFVVEVKYKPGGAFFQKEAADEALKKACDAEYPRAGVAEYEVTRVEEIK